MKLKLDKFRIDLVWNLISFLFIAFLGVFINAFISTKYDVSILGVFNQNYALYLFLSQLAVGGVHLGVQKYVPEHSANTISTHSILISALILTTISSVLVIFIALIFNHVPGKLMESDGVGIGFKYVLPGLLFFSYNKVLLAFLNGIRKMKAFAFFQFLRFFLMTFFIVLCFYLAIDPNKLAIILSATELVLFLILVSSIGIKLNRSYYADTIYWIKQNFKFGNKALVGNFLFDANTKVDIFLIGVFLSDRLVGIYSFAALIFEGFGLIPVIFRNNINPIISKSFKSGNNMLLAKIINLNIRKFYKFIAGIGILGILAFPIVIWIFGQTDYLYEMWAVYTILSLGVICTAGFQPFIMLFNQLGHPEYQTYFIFCLASANVLLNLIFIPFFGIYGSAFATALSNLVIVIFLKRYSAKLYLINI